ncbi:unnamed protein product [marine sediment metagenome]|uniref:PIN domain-containing protein n=1 Tax=marine sediment metagenome TaxID=412755 RepID=X1A9M9_9ZZZZ
MKYVFWDTGAIYAFLNKKDKDHERVKAFIERYSGKLIITNYIFSEAVTLVQKRNNHKTAEYIGKVLRDSSNIESFFINQKREKEAWLLFCARKDKEYSVVDCTSFIVMKELGCSGFLGNDEHFRWAKCSHNS